MPLKAKTKHTMREQSTITVYYYTDHEHSNSNKDHHPLYIFKR